MSIYWVWWATFVNIYVLLTAFGHGGEMPRSQDFLRNLGCIKKSGGPFRARLFFFGLLRRILLKNGQHACDQWMTDNVLVTQSNAGNVFDIFQTI